jgi:hypothetical protein
MKSEIGLWLGKLTQVVGVIDLRLDVDGIPVGTDPAIVISGSEIKFYENYAEGILEGSLNLRDGDNGYYVGDIKDYVDASLVFSGSRWSEDISTLRSKYLIEDTSIKISSEFIENSSHRKLSHGNVMEYQISSAVIKTEVETLAEVVAEDSFYVDKQNGVVFTGTPTSFRIEYVYGQFPFFLRYCEVQASEVTLNDDNQFLLAESRYWGK